MTSGRHSRQLQQKLGAAQISLQNLEMHAAMAGSALDPHGRDARHPAQIPLRGWKDVLWRVKDAIVEDDVMTVAAGTTYYLLLSIVPMLSAFVSIYGLFSNPAMVQEQLDAVREFIPGGGMDILAEQLNRLVTQPSSGLGLAFAGSLLVALWTANAGMKALISAMNVAYDEREKRGFVRLTLTSLAFTIAAIVMMSFTVAATVVLPRVLAFMGVANPLGLRLASLALLFVMAVVGLSSLYRWGPSRSSARWVWISPGAAFTLLVAGVAAGLFSWYVSAFGSYNKAYGSLGAIIGFMTWLWIMSMVIIAGAELNAEIEHQTLIDTTTGRPRPMGRRGARMADTIGVGADMTPEQARAADLGPKGESRAHEGGVRIAEASPPGPAPIEQQAAAVVAREEKAQIAAFVQGVAQRVQGDGPSASDDGDFATGAEAGAEAGRHGEAAAAALETSAMPARRARSVALPAARSGDWLRVSLTVALITSAAVGLIRLEAARQRR